MIAVNPDNAAGRLLAAVVAAPGELDAEALGQRLWKPPLTGTEDYLRVRRAIQQDGSAWTKKASNLLHRLQQQGLIERCRAPLPGPALGQLGGEGLEDLAGTLLETLVRHPPPTMHAWVGAAPSGNIQRALKQLAEARLVILPSQRWPTEAGKALVASWVQAREAA